MPSDRPTAAVVLGARNLRGAITRDLLGRDIRVATVARTQPDLDVRKKQGAITIPADAGEPDQLTRALARAEAAIGAPDLIVNAVSAAHPPATARDSVADPSPAPAWPDLTDGRSPSPSKHLCSLEAGRVRSANAEEHSFKSPVARPDGQIQSADSSLPGAPRYAHSRTQPPWSYVKPAST